jgi:hypothetical protein
VATTPVVTATPPTVDYAGIKTGTSFTVSRSEGGKPSVSVVSNTSNTSYTADTSVLKPNTIYQYSVASTADPSLTIFMTIRTPLFNGWNIFAVPNNATLSASNAFASQVGTVYEWVTNGTNKESDTTQLGSYTPVTTLAPGKGYFVKTNNGSTLLSYNGTANATPVTVTLKPGWTMIANPNTTNMTNIGTSWQISGQPLSAAVTAGTIGGSLYWWNGSTYEFWSVGSNPQVEPWKGYWIVNQTSGNLTLTLQ